MNAIADCDRSSGASISEHRNIGAAIGNGAPLCSAGRAFLSRAEGTLLSIFDTARTRMRERLDDVRVRGCNG